VKSPAFDAPRAAAHPSCMKEKFPDRKVLAVVPDLFFATRIAATALAAGVTLEMASPQAALARAAQAKAQLVIIDLHARDAVAIVQGVKAADPQLPVVGFHSHVDRDLKAAALAAGADAVLPRSRFTVRLAELLQQGLLALGPEDAR
jgi:DNA-binding NarL/FixJ family response regulator